MTTPKPSTPTDPGPCRNCGSTNTKQITTRPPKVKASDAAESKTGHRCTPACDQPFRLCLNCRLAAPLVF
jgi:hypothetical protein